jgi:hypothetical protein
MSLYHIIFQNNNKKSSGNYGVFGGPPRFHVQYEKDENNTSQIKTPQINTHLWHYKEAPHEPTTKNHFHITINPDFYAWIGYTELDKNGSVQFLVDVGHNESAVATLGTKSSRGSIFTISEDDESDHLIHLSEQNLKHLNLSENMGSKSGTFKMTAGGTLKTTAGGTSFDHRTLIGVGVVDPSGFVMPTTSILAKGVVETTITPQNRFWIAETRDDLAASPQTIIDIKSNSISPESAYVDFSTAPAWVNTAIVIHEPEGNYKVSYEASPAPALDAIASGSLADYLETKPPNVVDSTKIKEINDKIAELKRVIDNWSTLEKDYVYYNGVVQWNSEDSGVKDEQVKAGNAVISTRLQQRSYEVMGITAPENDARKFTFEIRKVKTGPDDVDVDPQTDWAAALNSNTQADEYKFEDLEHNLAMSKAPPKRRAIIADESLVPVSIHDSGIKLLKKNAMSRLTAADRRRPMINGNQ